MDEHETGAGPAPSPVRPDAKPQDTRQDECERHGAFISMRYARYWTKCPSCDQQAVEERRKEEERRLAEHIARRISAAGLVGRFESATFDSFKATTKEQRAVVTRCRDFAQEVADTTGAGLLLIGPPGTGKTHLMSAIVRHVLLAKRPLVYRGRTEMVEQSARIITARDLIRRLRATWKPDARETEAELLEELRDAEVLALDDVGVSFGTEAEQVQLLDVIDSRYRLRRPTIVSSNLSLPELSQAIGERSFDRLREGAKVLLCTWPSHRGRA